MAAATLNFSHLQLSAHGISHVGMRRKQNQDHFLLAPELGLFIVADGMGGHQGGETASHLAIATLKNFFNEFDPELLKQPPEHIISTAISLANQTIQKKGNEDSNLQGMGTTTTLLWFFEKKLYIGHVGDSRCYFSRADNLWQLTRDHSLVQEKLRAGLITREQLKEDRAKNIITRSVGFESEVQVDVYSFAPEKNDVFLVCSDGLSGMLEDSAILSIVKNANSSHTELAQKVENLISLANTNGGDDNVTAILIQVL